MSLRGEEVPQVSLVVVGAAGRDVMKVCVLLLLVFEATN